MVERWANQTDSGQNKLPPSDDRWKVRSKTYAGIAAHYFGAHLTACEIDADYYAAAMARIKRETAQTTLFT